MTPKIVPEVICDLAERQEVADFIESSANGTIFHRPRFLSYHGQEKFTAEGCVTLHIVFRENSRIVGFLPGVVRASGSSRVFLSPWGASFGGMVTGDANFDRCESMVVCAMEHLLRVEGVDEIRIAPPTRIYMGNAASDYLPYLYFAKGFRLVSSELTIATMISENADFPRSVLRDRVKSAASQGRRKGLRCEIGTDVAVAYPIICDDQKKFGKEPTHTEDELERICELFPGRVLFFTAYQEALPIATVCLMLCNKVVAYTFYIDQLETHSDARPVDLLLCEVLTWLKANGYGYLDFGPSTFGAEPHRSLIFFKEGFGGRGVIKNFYCYSAKRA